MQFIEKSKRHYMPFELGTFMIPGQMKREAHSTRL